MTGRLVLFFEREVEIRFDYREEAPKMDPKEFVRKEWEVLKASRTFRTLVAMEVGAVSLFVEQVVDGKVELSLDSLKGWVALQVALVVAFLLRQALAGVEAQLEGKVPPEILRRIEERVGARAMATLGKSHPEAAAKLREALATPPPEEGT